VSSWKRSLYLVAGLAVAFVLASAAVLAARQGSWGPLESVAWVPALLFVTLSPRTSRCLPRRRQPR